MAELFGSEDETVSNDLSDEGLAGKQILKAVSISERNSCLSS